VSSIGDDSSATSTTTAAATTTTTPEAPAATTTTAVPTEAQRTAELAAEIVASATTIPAGATPSTTAAGTHSHGVVTPEQPLTRPGRQELAGQLTQARAAAEKYPTVADAEAAGYTMVTGYVPLIGAHYIKWSLMDGNFNVDTPEMLLYDGSDPDSTI